MREFIVPPSSPDPFVVVHGAEHAATAMAAAARSAGGRISLLSAEDAAGFAGTRWWMALVRDARASWPAVRCLDLLDCGDAPVRALEALRLGQRRLVLRPAEPDGSAQHRNLLSRAGALGADVLDVRPPALDLAERGATRLLAAWLDRVHPATRDA